MLAPLRSMPPPRTMTLMWGDMDSKASSCSCTEAKGPLDMMEEEVVVEVVEEGGCGGACAPS